LDSKYTEVININGFFEKFRPCSGGALRIRFPANKNPIACSGFSGPIPFQSMCSGS
jgi:hypothetical protein